MNGASTEFHLFTTWLIDAPVETIWRELNTPTRWPEWWPAVKEVRMLREGNAAGIGTIHRMRWTTALPYDLVFDMESTRIEPMSVIEGRARGEVEGVGRWTLRPEGTNCSVRYDWIVKVTKPWMIRLAFILRPVFRWNHNVVMERGRRGLVQRVIDVND